jgi:serine/threonine-protein phosphatase 2A regulatory subunit B'
MIRKAITDCFFALIHENHKFNGAAELLDILASIISGFAVPLREEHVQFFKNVIIQLHKVHTSSTTVNHTDCRSKLAISILSSF